MPFHAPGMGGNDLRAFAEDDTSRRRVFTRREDVFVVVLLSRASGHGSVLEDHRKMRLEINNAQEIAPWCSGGARGA